MVWRWAWLVLWMCDGHGKLICGALHYVGGWVGGWVERGILAVGRESFSRGQGGRGIGVPCLEEG